MDTFERNQFHRMTTRHPSQFMSFVIETGGADCSVEVQSIGGLSFVFGGPAHMVKKQGIGHRLFYLFCADFFPVQSCHVIYQKITRQQ